MFQIHTVSKLPITDTHKQKQLNDIVIYLINIAKHQQSGSLYDMPYHILIIGSDCLCQPSVCAMLLSSAL